MSGLLPLEEAVDRALAGIEPVGAELVPLAEAGGRVLAEPLAARRTQPPFDTSSMDGYAVRAADVPAAGATLTVTGASAAGHRFAGEVHPGEAVRIFTGAPLPRGADAILIQEDATVDGVVLTATEAVRPGQYVRRRGLDFSDGETLLAAGLRLSMADLALAAAMGHAAVPVRRRPRVAILATGDELVPPGEIPGPDQIVASTGYGLIGLIRRLGGEAIDLGIAPDDPDTQAKAVQAALGQDIDLLVTLGGASVGDHDIIRGVLAGLGMELDFWKIAMRPGKPLMFGRLHGTRVLGLPGNPVSSLVCALLFLRPMLDALNGIPRRDYLDSAVLGAPVRENDRRQDYLRATLAPGADGIPVATALPRQDSSMLSILASADCLILRPPHAPPAEAGAPCRVLRLPRGASCFAASPSGRLINES